MSSAKFNFKPFKIGNQKFWVLLSRSSVHYSVQVFSNVNDLYHAVRWCCADCVYDGEYRVNVIADWIKMYKSMTRLYSSVKSHQVYGY